LSDYARRSSATFAVAPTIPKTLQIRQAHDIMRSEHPKLEILDFGSRLKSQEPGAGKELHRNLVLVPEETLEH
jgi:hypothetical protein